MTDQFESKIATIMVTRSISWLRNRVTITCPYKRYGYLNSDYFEPQLDSPRLLQRFLGFAVFVLGLVFSISSYSDCINSNGGMDTMHQQQISLINDDGKIVKLESLIADDGLERSNGFQNICKSVVDETLILFVFSGLTNGRFHMHNVQSPLDIGFFDNKGRLISWMLMDTYDDDNSRLYNPGQPFQYALEARPGFFKDNGFTTTATRLLIHSIYAK